VGRDAAADGHCARKRCIFVQYDGIDRDDDGTQLPHPEAELREAGGYDDPNLAMFVKDASGEILFSVPFLGSLH
jgi:hypothetical protein